MEKMASSVLLISEHLRAVLFGMLKVGNNEKEDSIQGMI